MRYSGLFALSAMMLSVPAQAVNWHYYGDSDTFVGSVDMDSIRKTGSTVRAWQRRIYAKPQTSTIGAYVEMRVLQEVNCNDESVKMLSWVAYGHDGSVIGSKTLPSYEQERDYVVPGTMGESFLRAVCAN